MAAAGKRVLLVDLDPQANLTTSLDSSNEESNVYLALKGEVTFEPAEVTKNLFIVPSTLDLSGAEIELSTEAGREFLLKELIDPVRKDFDYIFIDCPPSLGLLTINALTAADEVFIPLQTQFLALQGLVKLNEVVEKIKKRLNKKLEIGGVILTQYDNRKKLNRDVADSVGEHYQAKVFNTKIRDNVSLAESPTAKQDIFRYAPKSAGAADYSALVQEIVARS
jgi:chromosome partitioning protein